MKTRKTDRAGQPVEVFERMSVPRALMTLSVPTIIGQLVVLIYSLADTFYIGRANNPFMVAGASLILPVYNICISLANITGVGGGTLISRLLGVGRREEAEKVSAFSFYLAIGFGALFALVLGLFMTPILRLLGASDETNEYARQYALCVIVAGGVPTVMALNLSNLLRSVGQAKYAGTGVTLGGLMNIALDPLFMFVLFPRGMETAAAGIATMCSNLIVCLYYAWVLTHALRQKDTRAGLSFSVHQGLPEGESIRSVFSVGIPASVATLLFDLDYVVIDRLATGYGDIPLAAIGIVLKAERLPLNTGVGLCQGMMPLAAYNYAAGNGKRMNDAVRTSRLYGLIMAAVSILLYELFAPQILGFFIADPETIAIGADFLRVRCLATPFMFMCFHLVNLFQAVGQGPTALRLAVVRWAVFNIPMLFLFNHLFGMYGIVWTQMVADMCVATISLSVYAGFLKKHSI